MMAEVQPTLFDLETWKPVRVAGFEGLYQVSSLGRVRSMPRVINASNRVIHYGTRIIKQNVDSSGYAQVTLCNEANRKTLNVHTLVAEAFIGTRPKGMDLCHNDGNTTHNHPHNLRWGTRSENTLDKYKHGTHNWMPGFVPRDRKRLRDKAKKGIQKYTSGQCDCAACAVLQQS